MRKLIIVLACIAMIVGIGFGILQNEKTRFSIEHILPQQALVYVQIHDVKENFQKLASMPVWQELNNINFDQFIDKNSSNAQQLALIDLARKQLSDVLSSSLSNRLFGKEVAFAAYSPATDMSVLVREMKTLSPKFFEELLSGFFLVTRVDADVKLAEFTSRFFNQFGDNVFLKQSEYKGEIVQTVTISNLGMEFGVVLLRDLLVIGVGEKAARTSIDVFNGEKPALAQDPLFEQIQSRALEPSHIAGFFNFEPLIKILKNQEANFINSDQWENVLARISGIKAFGFSSRLSPVIRLDSQFIFDPQQLSADYAPLYNCPPGENKTIRFTPVDVIGYQWSNCFKLDHYWDQIVQELKVLDSSSSNIDEIESKIGMSIGQDILPAFGEEIGGYIQDIQVGGFFPIPKLLFFIEINNRSKAEQLLEKLKNQPMVMLQEEDYKGVSLKYLALPLGQDVQPGYSFLDNYLLISTSRQLIKDSIDANKNKSMSLLENPSFKEINFGLTGKNRVVQFLEIGQIVEKIKGIAEWSNKWITAQDRKTQAFKTGGGKPLEEVNESIDAKESELKELRKKIIALEDQIWNMETKGLDISAQQTEMIVFKGQLDDIKADIVSENERKAGLVSIVQSYDKAPSDSAQRQLYLDGIIYPILESLKSIKTYGLRSTIKNNAFESSVFLKVVE